MLLEHEVRYVMEVSHVRIIHSSENKSAIFTPSEQMGHLKVSMPHATREEAKEFLDTPSCGNNVSPIWKFH